MPPSVTKTVRIREDQANKLALEYAEVTSQLMRALLDIFWHSQYPGVEILKLRQRLKK